VSTGMAFIEFPNIDPILYVIWSSPQS
jgi:hypothetical protein